MSDKLKELYEKVSGDDSLKESFMKGFEAISNDDEKKSFIIDFAKEQGITLTLEDFPKADNVQAVSEDDLDNVVGGAHGDAAARQCGRSAYAACCAGLGMAGFMDC